MNKKLIIAILGINLLFVGCSKTTYKTILNKIIYPKPSPELIIIEGGTKQLTIDIVKELAQKGENLVVEDFKEYIGNDIGSGLYIMEYPIDERFELLVGSSTTSGKPLYVLLKNIKTEKGIDIRSKDIDKFINE